MTLIPFAGQDPDEPPLSVPETKYLHRKSHTRPEMAARLFSMGHDTFDLSRRFKREEQTVQRWITVERCKARGLPNPYEGELA